MWVSHSTDNKDDADSARPQESVPEIPYKCHIITSIAIFVIKQNAILHLEIYSNIYSKGLAKLPNIG